MVKVELYQIVCCFLSRSITLLILSALPTIFKIACYNVMLLQKVCKSPSTKEKKRLVWLLSNLSFQWTFDWKETFSRHLIIKCLTLIILIKVNCKQLLWHDFIRMAFPSLQFIWAQFVKKRRRKNWRKMFACYLIQTKSKSPRGLEFARNYNCRICLCFIQHGLFFLLPYV